MRIEQRKRIVKKLAALAIAAGIALPTAFFVFLYGRAVNDPVYNLSILAGDGQEWEGSRGWLVYVCEQGEVTELTPDGNGGYTGLEPGQTYYCSRELSQELDSPVLRIAAANRTVSVFLDGSLVYTDCPGLDNRIGFLHLPMLDTDRSEPVTISLPPDYQGKILTIAQSSPVYSELQTEADSPAAVWPCEVTLYSGYAYESGLISSAVWAAAPSALLFAIQLIILAAFIWNARKGNFYPQLPLFSIALFFQVVNLMAQTDFFFFYFGVPKVDLVPASLFLSIEVFLLFVSVYAGRLRPFLLAAAAVHGLSCALFIAVQTERLIPYGDLFVFFTTLPRRTGFLAMAGAFAAAFYLARKEKKPFLRHLTRLFSAVLAAFLLFFTVRAPFMPELTVRVLTTFRREIAAGLPVITLVLFWRFTLLASAVAVLIELAGKITHYFTENALLASKNELAMESYANLRRQSDEIMMLRHDTMKHYYLLRSMAEESPERLTEYLDGLIGQGEQIRSVISSRNQTLDIILNGKIHEAAEKGVAVEIVRTDAPARLPLTDAELCCLFMNIMDNAVRAAAESGAENPLIRLDFHCKNHHFVFTCENTKRDMQDKKKVKKETSLLKGHGYGMKIIRQIMSRWGEEMISVEESGSRYAITIVLPLVS